MDVTAALITVAITVGSVTPGPVAQAVRCAHRCRPCLVARVALPPASRRPPEPPALRHRSALDDETDGAHPDVCQPRSASRFRYLHDLRFGQGRCGRG